MATVPKIYEAIAAIQAAVGNIPKNGVGPASQGAYKYVKNDDILEAIRTLMIKHKVITKPEILSYDMVERSIGKDRVVPMTVVQLRITYISVEDGSEFAVVVGSEGADNSDKGGRKAVTQAQKIANLLTFNIATGEPDPDGIDTPANVGAGSLVSQKIAKASSSGTHNEIKVFLGAAKLSGSVANTIGERISGGKPSAEWTNDEDVLKQVLAELKAGVVE